MLSESRLGGMLRCLPRIPLTLVDVLESFGLQIGLQGFAVWNDKYDEQLCRCRRAGIPADDVMLVRLLRPHLACGVGSLWLALELRGHGALQNVCVGVSRMFMRWSACAGRIFRRNHYDVGPRLVGERLPQEFMIYFRLGSHPRKRSGSERHPEPGS